MSELILRPARYRDAPQIAAMSCAFVEHGLPPAWSAARIARHIGHADSVVLTATSPGLLAGFAIMEFGDDTAHLNLLAVAPEHRRRGIGRRLVRWLELSALTAGTFVIELETRLGNEPAKLFYESLGYTRVAQLPGYYQGIEDAVRMRQDVRLSAASRQSY